MSMAIFDTYVSHDQRVRRFQCGFPEFPAVKSVLSAATEDIQLTQHGTGVSLHFDHIMILESQETTIESPIHRDDVLLDVLLNGNYQ